MGSRKTFFIPEAKGLRENVTIDLFSHYGSVLVFSYEHPFYVAI